MGFFADMNRAQKNINGFDAMLTPPDKLGKRWLAELDNVRRGRMQAEQIAEAMRGVSQAAPRTDTHRVPRAAPVYSTGNANRLAGRPEQAALEAQWAAAAALAPAPTTTTTVVSAGDVVNGHRLDWTGTAWVWTPVTA